MLVKSFKDVDKSLPQHIFSFSVRSNQDLLPRSTLSSKYGNFWLQKNKLSSNASKFDS